MKCSSASGAGNLPTTAAGILITSNISDHDQGLELTQCCDIGVHEFKVKFPVVGTMPTIAIGRRLVVSDV